MLVLMPEACAVAQLVAVYNVLPETRLIKVEIDFRRQQVS